MDQNELIEGLRNSDCYKTTQSIIRNLDISTKLSQEEIVQCIEIAISNKQVFGTLNYKKGSQVRDFYRSILEEYTGEKTDSIEKITELVFIIDNDKIVDFLEEQRQVIVNNDAYKKYEWHDEQGDLLFTLCDGLYHANSVSTALSYIKHQKIYSREYGESNFSNEQTEQWSDESDKKDGIYNDLFFDNCDCRLLSQKESAYGPVTFVIDEKCLKNIEMNIRISKTNPAMAGWSGRKYGEKYFKDIEELVDEAKREGEYPFRTKINHHTMIWNQDYIEISNVKYIIIEKHKDDDSISEKIKKKIEEELKKNGLKVPVVVRNKCAEGNLKRSAPDETLWKIPE